MSEASRFLRVAIAGEAGVLILGWGLSRWLGIGLADHLHLDARAILFGSLAAIPLLFGLHWTLRTSSKSVRHLVQVVLHQLGPLLNSRSVLELALLAVLAGVAEEILFRGVMQAELARRIPAVAAVIVTSMVFGLAHFLTLTYALLAAVAGMYLGALFWLQGNLAVPMVAHALYDFVALTQLVRMYRARPTEE